MIGRVIGVCLVGYAFVASGHAAATPSSDCVFEWNRPSNDDAQQELWAGYARGGSGLVIVGSDENTCMLASTHDGEPTFEIYWQDGDAFFRGDDESTGQFMEFKQTTGAIDVYVVSEGKVEPVDK